MVSRAADLSNHMAVANAIPTLETPRLLLRPFTPGDAPLMHRILNGPEVLRYFPPTDPPGLERVELAIARWLDHWRDRRYGLWAVADRSDGSLMGRCGLQYLPDTDETEVDFLLGRDFWGKGFASEAAERSLGFAFQTLHLETIVGIVHPENLASKRVLEKLGMTLQARARYFGMECERYVIERGSSRWV